MRTAGKFTTIRRAYYRVKQVGGLIRGQSDEGEILRRLVTESSAPKTFVEFGFHPIEFNCASLVSDHRGLLIDASERQTSDARALLPKSIRVERRFLDLQNLDLIRDAFPAIGVLSIDIDGNDYWFLEALIGLRPSVISIEYNASFLLQPITVPYDASFDRNAKHASGWYHGASLPALTKLARAHGYGLAAVSEGGMNAFFTRSGNLDPEDAWRPNVLRDAWSGTSATEQWQTVKDLLYVPV